MPLTNDEQIAALPGHTSGSDLREVVRRYRPTTSEGMYL